MFSKPLAFALLAIGCLTAAAGGAYVATRHNTADFASVPAAATSQAAQPSTAGNPAPVTETTVTPAPAAPGPVQAEQDEPPAAPVARPKPQPVTPPASRSARVAPQRTVSRPDPAPVAQAPAATPAPLPQVVPPAAPVNANGAESTADLPRRVDPQPEPPREPQFEELILPASSVIGLQVETALSSERARVEDRVDARVTRDVLVNGRLAIPAGSRVLGSVTLVDRGGKLKGAPRLGIRFHTLVLADGSEVALNTEPFYREGESPAGDSAKKIGGATAVGAILGGILGGGKGAVIGGATGAAGGTAAAMAGDRNAAVVAPGSIVTVHLSSPATIMVEKRQ